MSKNKPKKGKKSKVGGETPLEWALNLASLGALKSTKKLAKSLKEKISAKTVNTKAKNTKSSKTTYNQGGSFRTQHD